MTEPLIATADAKVNLFLRVLSREADGYHGIETLFCRLDLSDTLEARRTDTRGVELEVEGHETGPAEKNLAVRAATAVLEATGHRFGVHLLLTKRIPVGAGLGGGSADAAAALSLVNQLAGNAIPRAELLHHAARLGADVPFCLSGASLALAWSHGERMLALPPLPPAPVLLLTPRCRSGRPTRMAGWTQPADRGITEARSASTRRPWPTGVTSPAWPATISNRWSSDDCLRSGRRSKRWRGPIPCSAG